MLEELHFSTPPSSPPLGSHAAAAAEAIGRQHNLKASSVTWCTDYLEVMGCEKPHNFKVGLHARAFAVSSDVVPCALELEVQTICIDKNLFLTMVR